VSSLCPLDRSGQGWTVTGDELRAREGASKSASGHQRWMRSAFSLRKAAIYLLFRILRCPDTDRIMSPESRHTRIVQIERVAKREQPGKHPDALGRAMMADVVVKARYPHYGADMKALIADVHAKHQGDPEVNQRVIAAIWERPFYKIISLAADASQANPQGPDPVMWDDLTPARRAALQTYIDGARGFDERLQKLTDAELAACYDDVVGAAQATAAAQKLERGLKADVLAFFNRPAAAAEYAHWLRLAVWTAEEATALSLGKDPRHVNGKVLTAYNHASGSPFRDDYNSRLEQVIRALKAGTLTEPLSASKFLNWASRCQIDVHPDLVQSISVTGKDQSSTNENNGIHQNRLHQYQEIILGIAASKYGFDVTLNETDIQKGVYASFLRDLRNVDIKIDKKTIQKIVREALVWASESEQPIIVIAKLRKKEAQRRSQPPLGAGK